LRVHLDREYGESSLVQKRKLEEVMMMFLSIPASKLASGSGNTLFVGQGRRHSTQVHCL
jgi:hypothetical protein